MSKNANQNGFSLVESLLLIIAVALVTFVGYYIWHNQKHAGKTNTGATKTSQSGSKPAGNSAAGAQKYFTIKEWGVRAPYNGSDTFTYKFAAGDNNSLEVISQNLARTYGCTDFGAGQISRYSPTDDPSLDNPTPGGSAATTVAQDAAANPGTYAQAGNYYYRFFHDNAACSDKVTAEAQNAVNDTVKDLVAHFQAIGQ